MIEPIEIIYDVEALEGTCYVEIKPGKYTDKHWNKESIYFTDETFTYFSIAIEKHYKKYCLWGTNEIDKQTWELIITELENLKLFLKNHPKADDLKDHIGFFYLETTEKYFKEYLTQNVKDLIKVTSVALK
jgi:hypothetical protein